jgi:hypothetical protein
MVHFKIFSGKKGPKVWNLNIRVWHDLYLCAPPSWEQIVRCFFFTGTQRGNPRCIYILLNDSGKSTKMVRKRKTSKGWLYIHRKCKRKLVIGECRRNSQMIPSTQLKSGRSKWLLDSVGLWVAFILEFHFLVSYTCQTLTTGIWFIFSDRKMSKIREPPIHINLSLRITFNFYSRCEN